MAPSNKNKVFRITDKRVQNNTTEYYIEWVHTWETVEYMTNNRDQVRRIINNRVTENDISQLKIHWHNSWVPINQLKCDHQITAYYERLTNMVLPQSNVFTTRNQAQSTSSSATATQKDIRTLPITNSTPERKPLRINSAWTHNQHVMYLVQFTEFPIFDKITAEQAHQMCPKLIIDYLEKEFAKLMPKYLH